MFELIETKPDAAVQEAEYIRLLGFPPGYVLEGRPRELADAARGWFEKNGRPWIYSRQFEDFDPGAFSSQQLRDNFDSVEARGAMVTVVSAGRECEEQAREHWLAGKPDEYFFLEVYGSAVVEHLITVASGQICGWADGQGMVALPHYSPGYSGWDVADQGRLWNLIRPHNGHVLPGELQVMDSGMLNPKKSLLAVFGVTRHLDKVRTLAKLVPCENCSLGRCQFRRAPYLHSPPQIEDVRRLQGVASESISGLQRHAKYSINLKALRKWSQERLQLTARPDGVIEARFRYEGTTCSNMGRPLEFDYHILLSPAHDGHKILEISCRPAPGDTGHMSQCEYLKDGPAFMRSIDSEKPLRGRPLNEVLTWERAFTPSGCYCDAERRAHKWGLVYEVLHYTLVQREKNAKAAPK